MSIKDKCPAVRVSMFPHDTNGTGTNIFGGVILSHMDVAGGIAAREVTDHRVVTVSFDKVVFKQPVHVNDVLTCWAEVTRIGKTSITVHIVVEAQRKREWIAVTEGEAVYVAVDDNGKPVPVTSPVTSTANTPTPTAPAMCSACARKHAAPVLNQPAWLQSMQGTLARWRKNWLG
jgi:acyl-CoA thioesterase YciA